MPRPKRSSDVESQRAVVRQVEAAITDLHSKNLLNLLLYAYGIEGGLRSTVEEMDGYLRERVEELKALLEQEMTIHERLHELIDHPRRTVPDFGPLEGQARRVPPRAARARRNHVTRGDIDTRLKSAAVVKRPARKGSRGSDVELEQPDTWGSDVCYPPKGCTSMSKTLHAHCAVVVALEERLEEARELEERQSAWTPLLDDYTFLGSKPEILGYLKSELGFSWLDIMTFLSHRQRRKKLPIRESYLKKVAASARQMVSKFRQGQP
jgi:hypothetical protein